MDCPPTPYDFQHLWFWPWDLCLILLGNCPLSWLTGTVKELTNEYLADEEDSILNSCVLFCSLLLYILMFHFIVFFVWVSHTLGHCLRDTPWLIPSLQKDQKQVFIDSIQDIMECLLGALCIWVANAKGKQNMESGSPSWGTRWTCIKHIENVLSRKTKQARNRHARDALMFRGWPGRT